MSTTSPPAQEPSKPFYKQWLFWCISLYILFIVIYTIFFIRSDGANILLSSNELGDFLAGLFAPLAFLFLILGYYLQSQTIKQNKIESDKQLAILKQEFLSQQKIILFNAQPYFHVENLKIFKEYVPNSSPMLSITFTLKNSRALCRSLFFMYNIGDGNRIISCSHFDLIEGDQTIYNVILSENLSNFFKSHPFEKIHIKFMYTDTYDDVRTQILRLDVDNNPLNDEFPFDFQWQHNNTFLE